MLNCLKFITYRKCQCFRKLFLYVFSCSGSIEWGDFVAFVWLLVVGCLCMDSLKIETFMRFRKFQDQNVFQNILSNIDFLIPAPLTLDYSSKRHYVEKHRFN